MIKETKIISLGILAQKLGLPKSKLAYYDLIGLIEPANIMAGGMRVYREKEVTKKIKQILKFQEEGMSLQKIKEKFNK